MTTIISRITRLQHPGVLRDFSWPSNLPAFARFNLIYGWNGSGKTTLSRFFRHLEQRTVPTTGHVTFVVRGQTTRSKDFADQDAPIRVFNRDYVDENVFPLSGGEVPPIFVLGADSVRKQKELESLRTQRTRIDAKLVKARSRQSQANRRLDSFCRDQAKVIKDTLQIQGGAFNYFNKSHYLARVAQVRLGNSDRFRLSDESRNQLLRQHHSTHKAKLPAVRSPDVALIRAHTETVMQLVQETVVSSSISTLRDNPRLGAWVREGLRLHKEQSSATCLMCEQPLPDTRLKELEGHFNAAYERLLGRVDRSISEVTSSRDELRGLRWPEATAVYEDLAEDYREACSRLESRRDELCEHLDGLVRILEQKKAAPFRELAAGAPFSAEETDESVRLNRIVDGHNMRTDEFEMRTKEARERIADGTIVGRLDEFLAIEKRSRKLVQRSNPTKQILIESRSVSRS